MSFMDMFEKMKAKSEKKKKEKGSFAVIGKSRGGQTKDADETMKELEKEGKNYASVDE